jgi:CRISPR-associated endonuclease/helicase Cas3
VSLTDSRLLSHPDKLLSVHVAEVREAAQVILRRYTPDPERERLISEIVNLHDLGKTTPAFQEYIRDPTGYKSARNRKAHTPVGFAATLLLGEQLGRDPFWTLCVAAAVLGHHSAFPNSRRLTSRYLRDDSWAKIIEEQARVAAAGSDCRSDSTPLLSCPPQCGVW